MRDRTRDVFFLAVAIVVLVITVVVVAGLIIGREGPDGNTPRDTMTGVIVGIDSGGLDAVRGFDLRNGEGEVVSFVVRNLENGAEFPPGHLAEHQATAESVVVTYRYQGIDRVALRIDDAP